MAHPAIPAAASSSTAITAIHPHGVSSVELAGPADVAPPVCDDWVSVGSVVVGGGSVVVVGGGVVVVVGGGSVVVVGGGSVVVVGGGVVGGGVLVVGGVV